MWNVKLGIAVSCKKNDADRLLSDTEYYMEAYIRACKVSYGY